MAKTKTTPYDTADYLKTEEDRALYFEACLDEAGDDSAFIAKALGDIARARGMTQLARDTGLAREGLYKALSGQGNPEFATILKVINALGLRLHAGVDAVVAGISVDDLKILDEGTKRAKLDIDAMIGVLAKNTKAHDRLMRQIKPANKRR